METHVVWNRRVLVVVVVRLLCSGALFAGNLLALGVVVVVIIGGIGGRLSKRSLLVKNTTPFR